jgi:hypothetical protein
MHKRVLVFAALVVAAGCGKDPTEQLAQLSTEYVYTTLSFSPSLATSVGLHEHEKQKLDECWTISVRKLSTSSAAFTRSSKND